MKRPAVFLDRDNTLIVSDGYLGDPDGVVLVSGAADLVARVRRLGYAAVTFSNQSGVARGLFTEEDVHHVNSRLDEMLADHDADAVIDRHEFCPHHPEAVVPRYRQASEFRKPAPGMIYQAARQLGLDLGRSWVIGDAPRDIEAGRAAGCRTILFRDSALPQSAAANEPLSVEPDFVAATLHEAGEIIANSPSVEGTTTEQTHSVEAASRRLNSSGGTPFPPSLNSSGGTPLLLNATDSTLAPSAGPAEGPSTGSVEAASTGSNTATLADSDQAPVNGSGLAPLTGPGEVAPILTEPAAVADLWPAEQADAPATKDAHVHASPVPGESPGVEAATEERIADQPLEAEHGLDAPIEVFTEARLSADSTSSPQADSSSGTPLLLNSTSSPRAGSGEATAVAESLQDDTLFPAASADGATFAGPQTSPESRPASDQEQDMDKSATEPEHSGDADSGDGNTDDTGPVRRRSPPAVILAAKAARAAARNSVPGATPEILREVARNAAREAAMGITRDYATAAPDGADAVPAPDTDHASVAEIPVDSAFEMPTAVAAVERHSQAEPAPLGTPLVITEQAATAETAANQPVIPYESKEETYHPDRPGRLEEVAEQILLELKRRNDANADFSVSKLLAGITMVVSLALLVYAYLYKNDWQTLQSLLLLGLMLQAITISLLIMGRQK